MMSALEFSSPSAEYLYRAYQMGITIFPETQVVVSTLEAAFYNRVKVIPETANEITFLVTHLAISYFSELQAAFSCLNGILTLSAARQIVQIGGYTAMGGWLPAIGLTAAMFCLSAVVLTELMQNTEEETTECKTIKSRTQILSAATQVTGVVYSLALAVLTQNKITFLLRAALNVYSLAKNTQLNWTVLKFSVTPEKPSEPLPRDRFVIERLDATYSALFLDNQHRDDHCGICRDGDDLPEQTFCTNSHPFHKKCLESNIESVATNMLKIEDCTRTALDHYTYGIHTHTTHVYDAKIKEENLPSCPTCRQRPPQNQLSITLVDSQYGEHPLDIEIIRENPKDWQTTFEKVNALYGLFQAGLTCLQQIPEFAPAITTLRSYLILTDIASGMMTTHYLYKCSQEHWSYLATALVALPVFLTLRSFFAFSGDLSHLASQGVSAQWCTPFYEKMSQGWNTYRFLATAGLTYFSKGHKVFNATSLITQGVGLWGSLSLPWLWVGQNNLQTPYSNVSKAAIDIYSLMSSYAAKSASHLKNAIHGIADLQRNIVAAKPWTLYTTYVNNIPTRSFEISYKLPEVGDIREFITQPFTWLVDGSASSSIYGRLSISIG